MQMTIGGIHTGGIGKTTVAVTVDHGLALMGLRVGERRINGLHPIRGRG